MTKSSKNGQQGAAVDRRKSRLPLSFSLSSKVQNLKEGGVMRGSVVRK